VHNWINFVVTVQYMFGLSDGILRIVFIKKTNQFLWVYVLLVGEKFDQCDPNSMKT
jgi:hypothetical protein